MIEGLIKNIEHEEAILKEIDYLFGKIDDPDNLPYKKQINEAITSLNALLKTNNNSIEDILKSFSGQNRINANKNKFETINSNLSGENFSKQLFLKKQDKEKALKELRISEEMLKRIRNKDENKKSEDTNYQPVRGYLKLSNRLFLSRASNLVKKGYFFGLRDDIKKSNMDILLETYVSMMFLTTLIAFSITLASYIALSYFDINITEYTIALSSDVPGKLLKLIWIPFLIPITCFYALYIYPSTEKDDMEKKINSELPFAVIHMSSISGSGISPVEIFKIIAVTSEYPHLGKEIRKVLNQINVYGYDLITAINNVSKVTPSNKLSELFAGMSATINSGGDLSDFFEKRSESLMMDYRLEREKFSKLAETFMDIYISVVIAAPMIFMLLIVMINITGNNIAGLNTQSMTLVIVGILAIMNVLFLGFLQIKQPNY